MSRHAYIVAVALVLAAMAVGCSGMGTSPVAPTGPGLAQAEIAHPGHGQTHLWGLYDVHIDIPTQTATGVLDRQAMFAANVVQFLNANPLTLQFHINGTLPGPGYVDVDIDVGITHPFPGLPQYNGYDVRGVFMGDGYPALKYNPELIYADPEFHQTMLDDPTGGGGGPDGYTRWFNYTEFSTGGMPLFQYTQGKAASSGFAGTATLNPYRYFADGLGASEDLWTWLDAHAAQHGVFSSGATNTRNYYLRFPTTKGVIFGYAIVADWKGPEPENHPANAPEAVALSVIDNSDVFFKDLSVNGGRIILDISVWDWDSHPVGGVMQDYGIIVESTVLKQPHYFTVPEMTPVGGTDQYSTYHVEIMADDVIGLDDNQYWIIVESPNENYTNEYGVANLAGDEPLAAFFKYPLTVLNAEVNLPPICDLVIDPLYPVPFEDFAPIPVKFDATGSWDPNDDPLTYEWDFDGDGVFGEPVDDFYKGNSDTPTHPYLTAYDGKAYVKVIDNEGAFDICSVDVQVLAHQSKNIPIRNTKPTDIGVDPTNADVWIVFSDGLTYKYTKSAWYQNETYAYGGPGGTILFMDIASGGFAQYVDSTGTHSAYLFIKNSTGATLQGMGWGSAGGPYFWCDAFNYGTTGEQANQLGWVVGALNSLPTMYNHYILQYSAQTYTTQTYMVDENQSLSPLTGLTDFFHEWVRGIDTDTVNGDLWILEAYDYYCATFYKFPVSSWYQLQYHNRYFGTGAEATDDSCWTVNVCDLGRTPDNRFHVLDNVGGVGVIKVFTGNATGGTSFGHYGDAATILGTPLKLDGSDMDSNMVVLHGDATNGYSISVFKPIEMP